MYWKNKKSKNVDRNDDISRYSISEKLEKEGKFCEELEVFINNIPLEDLIALKLELSTKSIGNRFVGLQFWHQLRNIIADAMLKYLFSISISKKEIAAILGVSYNVFKKIDKKYNTEKYFEINSIKRDENDDYF